MSALPRARAVTRTAVKRAGGRALSSARRRGMHPELSVVMPVYNVSEYLDAAIDSVLGQSLHNLELIAVDDGSTDGSLDILHRRAKLDHRLVVLTQPNAGQGAARNTGVAIARGDFLTFIDSDDEVPLDAYEHMVTSLRTSGSDFSVGSVVRLRHREKVDTSWVRTVHARDRLGITLEDFPNAMQDIICCNRMFRTAFWREQIGGFQSHIAYEDHVPMLAAYVRAAKFDILGKVTYHWRIRLSSTGHKKADIGNLLDRIEVKEQAHEMLLAEASEFVHGLWVGRTLEVDFPPFLAIARTADDAYRNLVSATFRTFLGRASEEALDSVRVANKIRAQLAAEGRWDDLEDAEAWLHNDPQLLTPTRVSQGRVLATAPEGAHFMAGLAPGTLRMAALETHFQGVLQSVRWADDHVTIGGWTLLRGVTTSPDASHRAWLTDGEETIPLEARTVGNTLANVWGRQTYADYSNGGFEVTIPFAALPARTARWRVMVEMTDQGIVTEGALEFRVRESAAVTPNVQVFDTGSGFSSLSIGWTDSEGTLIEVDGSPAVIESVDPVQDRTVTGVLSRPVPGLNFRARGTNVPVKVSPLDGGRARFSATLPAGRQLSLQGAGKKPVLWAHPELRNGETIIRPSRVGGIQVLTGLPHLEVVDVTCNGDDLTLTARIDYLGVAEEELQQIRLGSGRGSHPPVSVRTDGSRATLVWSLTESTFGFPARQIPSQSLRIQLARNGSNLDVRASRELAGRTPIWHETSAFDLKVGQLKSGPVSLSLRSPQGLAHRGAAAQHRLREAYWASTAQITDSAFFQCYRGEFATDSQAVLDRAIAARFPDMERIWGVQDPGTRLPAGSRGVVMNTPEWYDAIAGARFLCNNIDFGGWFRKRDGQHYLQTFHGYPFKSMGIGFWESKDNSQEAIDRLVARVNAEWDTILVPSELCVDLYRREYQFEGEILVAGIPRTDPLVNSDTAQVRTAVLTRLGIDPSKRVVLYAPTYRDKLTTKTYAAERFDDLDLDHLVRRLGEDYVVLLRGHNNNQRTDGRVNGVVQVLDVTDYPEINDLTLAADAAVLDYSSLRFDWAITGKPMVFFVPDMEDYFELRPPLFGFEDSAPGPLLRTTDEVADQLLDLDAVSRTHGGAIAAFNERFNTLNDGHAAERVLDRFFG